MVSERDKSPGGGGVGASLLVVVLVVGTSHLVGVEISPGGCEDQAPGGGGIGEVTQQGSASGGADAVQWLLLCLS